MLFNRKPPASEKRISLNQIDWPQFEALLQDLGNQRSTRITYYQGKLQMFDPHPHHDRIARLLDSLLLALADEAGDDLFSLGAQLLKHPAMGIAIQPDMAYYLARRTRPSDRAELDLQQVPAPDLVIDIQLEKASPKRLGLLAGLGVPEIWQYVTSLRENEVLQGELRLLQLQDSEYVVASRSQLYDFLPAEYIHSFIQQSDTIGLPQALTELRSWANQMMFSD